VVIMLALLILARRRFSHLAGLSISPTENDSKRRKNHHDCDDDHDGIEGHIPSPIRYGED
jgi:hypothetical protein